MAATSRADGNAAITQGRKRVAVHDPARFPPGYKHHSRAGPSIGPMQSITRLTADFAKPNSGPGCRGSGRCASKRPSTTPAHWAQHPRPNRPPASPPRRRTTPTSSGNFRALNPANSPTHPESDAVTTASTHELIS